MANDLDTALKRLSPQRPPVLLLGGLDLLRPLGFAGIPAIVATPNARDPALDSRYCSDRCLLPPLERPEEVVQALLAAGDRIALALGCRVPLFYGNDDTLQLVSAAREALAARFLLLLNEPAVSVALMEKICFRALARERGLAVPRTLAWDELGAAAHPVLAKPRVKVGWDDSAIHLRLFGGHGKARVFGSGREVLAHPLAMHLRDQLTFQEYIAGDDRQLWSFHGYADERSRLLGWFIGRKLRTYPSLTGMSSYLELAHDDELAALGRDIVARVPLRGVFKIDFKRDAASGRCHVLEINARFNLWHHVAAKNGVNLPQVAYDHLVYGAQPVPAPYGTRYRWLCPRLDFLAYREAAARGELGFARWLASLLRARKVYDLFSWTDSAPWLHAWSNRARARLRRELGSLRLRLQRWLSTAS